MGNHEKTSRDQDANEPRARTVEVVRFDQRTLRLRYPGPVYEPGIPEGGDGSVATLAIIGGGTMRLTVQEKTEWDTCWVRLEGVAQCGDAALTVCVELSPSWGDEDPDEPADDNLECPPIDVSILAHTVRMATSPFAGPLVLNVVKTLEKRFRGACLSEAERERIVRCELTVAPTVRWEPHMRLESSSRSGLSAVLRAARAPLPDQQFTSLESWLAEGEQARARR